MKCEICEMERDWCVHGLADRKTHQQPTHVTDELLVSPAGLAHLDGGNGTTACEHKVVGDFQRRGALIGIKDAWQRLSNNEHIKCNGGARTDLVATRLCSTCERIGR